MHLKNVGWFVVVWFLTLIPASAQAPRKWRLAEDLIVSPAQANPSPDRYANPAVWHYFCDTSFTHDPASFYLLPDFHGNVSLPGWMDVFGPFQDSPFVLVNKSAKAVNFGTFSWPVGLAGVSPVNGRAAVVGWKSPFTGTVQVRGYVEDFEKQARGNGVAWQVNKGNTPLATGTIAVGGNQSFQQGNLSADLRAVSVTAGDFLYFIVDVNGDEQNDVTRLDVNIDEVIVPVATVLAGSAPSSGAARGQGAYDAVNQTADPVHSVFGTFTTQVTDLRVGGELGIGGLARTYNSAFPEDGLLGFGWSLAYDLRITNANATDVDVKRGDGRVDRFTANGGGFDGPPGIGDTLVNNGNGFTLTTRDRLVYVFNAAGRLLSATDRFNHVVQLTYDVNGRWTGLTEPSARVWTIAYGKNGKISAIIDPAKRAVKFAYSAAGDLISVANPLNGKTLYAYDAEHRLTKITDARKIVVLQNSYDAAGRVSSQTDARGLHSFAYQAAQTIYTDPVGNDWTTAFDMSFRVTGRTDPLGNTVNLAYNAAGLVTTETDARGKATTYTYDAAGRRLTITDALAGVTTFTYDVNGNLATVKDARDSVTTYGYDGLNRITSITDAENGITTFAYAATGLLASTTDPTGGSTTFTYDANGNRTVVTDPLGKTTLFQYDAAGLVSAQTDALTRVTKFTYDKLGRLTSRTAPDRGKVKFTYDAVGNVTKETDALSRATAFTYSAASDLLTIKNPLKGVTSFEYDALGRLKKTTTPDGAATTFLYDAAGRRTRETNALGHATNFGYDQNGNLTTVTDALNNATTYAFDDLNRITSVTDTLAGQSVFTYDAVGNRLTTKDALNRTTTFDYDSVNRLTSETDALANVRTFDYDEAGRLTSRTNGAGETIDYVFDLAGRLTSVDDGTNTTAYTYDDVGNRLTMTDTLGTTNYQYDTRDRLIVADGPQGRLAYTYDKHGNRTKVAVDAALISYTYDKLNRVGSARSGKTKVSYLYDKAGRNTAEIFSNGVKTTRSYDAAGRVVSIATTGGRPTAELFRADYTYDALGRRLTETSPDFTSSYTYDALNRLTAAALTTGATPRNFTYTYDATGNRLTANEDGFAKTYTYDAANRIATFNTTPYTYDNDGRLTTDHAGAFTYDAFGHLKTAGISAYAYDGDGRNVSETRNGVTTTYLIDNTAPLPLRLAQMNGTNTTVNLFGLSLAAQIDSTGDVFFQHTDALGSIRLRTIAGAAIDQFLDYAPFGSRLLAFGEGGAFSFTGEPYTNGSLLVNLRARYYSPIHGRFITTDPVENPLLTQTVNLYTYVANNPVNLTDPSGEEFNLLRAIGQGAQSLWNGVTGLFGGGKRRTPPAPRPVPPPPAPVPVAPLISGNGSTLISDKGLGVINGNGSTVINGNGSTVINGNGSTVINGNGSSILTDNASGVINGNGSTFRIQSEPKKPSGAQPFGAGDITDERKTELILRALAPFFGGGFAGGN